MEVFHEVFQKGFGIMVVVNLGIIFSSHTYTFSIPFCSTMNALQYLSVLSNNLRT